MENMLGKLSLQDILGPIKDLLEKIAGPQGEEWLTALKRFLRKENPWTGQITIRKNSVRIKTGGRSKIKELIEKLPTHYRNYIKDSDVPKTGRILFFDMCDHFDMAFVSVSELGFETGASYREILKRAELHGLEKANCLVALCLREQHQKIPVDGQIIVASEPFGVDRQILEVHSGSGAISLVEGSLDNFWGPDTVFAFIV